MTAIIEAIDAWTASRYHAYNKKLYGFCELIKKTAEDKEQVMPVTIPSDPTARRQHVSIDDKYTLITWMRWAEPVKYEPSEEFSFGKSEARLGTVPLRLVFAHKIILGEDLVFDFINAFPSQFKVSGFKFVFVDGAPIIDPDHESIFRTEFSDTVYEKHRLNWNLYVININIQFLECNELTP